MMKVAESTKYGGPEVIGIVEKVIPTPGPNDILIKVQASTVNRTDCGFLLGKPFIVRFFSGLIRPKDTVLGGEFSGDVVSVGSEVSEFKKGDAVFGLNTDRFNWGCHAEYLCIPKEASITHKPAHITHEEAAASLEGSWLAHTFLKTLDIGPDTRILINGASGSIGSAAVQICKYKGAKITAVIGTEHVDLAYKLGADNVIDYKTEDFTKIDDQFDYICDAVGKSTFFKCKRLLKPKGIYVSTEFGPYVQNAWLTLITPLTGGKKVVFPIPQDAKEDAEFIRDLWEKDAYQAVIDKHYELEEIADAYNYALTGEKIGNLIIKMGPNYNKC